MACRFAQERSSRPHRRCPDIDRPRAFFLPGVLEPLVVLWAYDELRQIQAPTHPITPPAVGAWWARRAVKKKTHEPRLRARSAPSSHARLVRCGSRNMVRAAPAPPGYGSSPRLWLLSYLRLGSESVTAFATPPTNQNHAWLPPRCIYKNREQKKKKPPASSHGRGRWRSTRRNPSPGKSTSAQRESWHWFGDKRRPVGAGRQTNFAQGLPPPPHGRFYHVPPAMKPPGSRSACQPRPVRPSRACFGELRKTPPGNHASFGTPQPTRLARQGHPRNPAGIEALDPHAGTPVKPADGAAAGPTGFPRAVQTKPGDRYATTTPR